MNTCDKTNLFSSICNKNQIIKKFIIINNTHLFKQNTYIRFVQNIIKCEDIKKYENTSGIMIDIQNISFDVKIYLFTFDDFILILESQNLFHFYEYFNKNNNKLLFISNQAEKEFLHFLSTKTILPNIQQNTPQLLESDIDNIIINSIIKKSQYLTILNRSKFQKNINFNISNLDDFISINTLSSHDHKSVQLCYNYKDHHLYIMKIFYGNELLYEHETNFYNKIANNFPFISRMFGTFEQYGRKYIIIEYIEGDTLKNFIINSPNKIDYSTKIAIILKMLLTVEYIHCNGICLRDLKWDNIIIDSKLNPIFIDFDFSKQMINNLSPNNLTGDIGCYFFAAPEQYQSRNYSFKVDNYSIGLLIHFILSEIHFNQIDVDYIENIFKAKGNILDKKEINKLPSNMEDLLDVYKNCCVFLPESRPSINKIIKGFLIQQKEKKSKLFVSFLDFFINLHFNYLSKFSFDYDNEKNYLEDKSELFCYFGQLLSEGKYIYVNIDKSVEYLILSAKYQNSEALFMLGILYFVNIF